MTLIVNFQNFIKKVVSIFNGQNNTKYGGWNKNSSSIIFETKVSKSSLYDYSDTCILVTEDIKATGDNANTKV